MLKRYPKTIAGLCRAYWTVGLWFVIALAGVAAFCVVVGAIRLTYQDFGWAGLLTLAVIAAVFGLGVLVCWAEEELKAQRLGDADDGWRE